jgi:hypothetical protein
MDDISHSLDASVEMETEEELGIFQLLDSLEEVTSRVTSR